MHRARVWLSVAAFAGGVVAGWREPPVLVLACAGVAGLCVAPVRSGILRLAGLAAIASVCGATVVSFHVARRAPIVEAAARYPRCSVEGTIAQRSSLGTFVRLRRLVCDGERLPSGAAVVVGDDVGDLGGRLATTGWLSPLQEEGIDGARRRAGAAASLDATSYEVGPPAGPISRAASAIRRSLRKATRDRPPTTAGLLQGLAIGETDRLPHDAGDALRRAGLSHLVAVSGTNVTIVLTVVASLVGRISRRIRLWACSGALVLFVAVVGPDPSVLRAASMGAVGLLALVAGSRSSPLDALAVAVVCVLAAWPHMIHSVGLHLSVAATAGICLWAGDLQEGCPHGPHWLRGALAVTVSAQVAVAPILVLVFGEISVSSLVANLLAAPAVAPATVIGLAAAIVGLLSDGAARALITLAAPFADWIATVGEALGAPAWTSITVPSPLGVVPALGIVSLLVISTVRADRMRRLDPVMLQSAGTRR